MRSMPCSLQKPRCHEPKERVMTAPSAVFPLWHIALTATITAVITLVVTWWARRGMKVLSGFDLVLIALVAGGSVLLWRAAGNVPVCGNVRRVSLTGSAGQL